MSYPCGMCVVSRLAQQEGPSWIADLLFIVQKCVTRGWVGSVVAERPALYVHYQTRDLTTEPSRFCRHWCKLRIKRSSRCRAELKTSKTYTGGVGVQRHQPRHLAMPLHSGVGIENCVAATLPFPKRPEMLIRQLVRLQLVSWVNLMLSLPRCVR